MTKQRRGVLQEDRVREAVTDIGGETKLDSRTIARDPRKMKPDELRAFGHIAMTPLSALRSRCIDCCGGSVEEVRSYTAFACPAWPFRMGANPWRVPLSDAEKARRRILLARVGKSAGNSSELEKSRRVLAGLPPAAVAAPEDDATML